MAGGHALPLEAGHVYNLQTSQVAAPRLSTPSLEIRERYLHCRINVRDSSVAARARQRGLCPTPPLSVCVTSCTPFNLYDDPMFLHL